MKIYTEIIKSCSECPEYIWSTEYGDKCRKNYRDIEYNHIIQEWCPLPNAITDNFICEMSAEECLKCEVECAEKEIKLLLK